MWIPALKKAYESGGHRATQEFPVATPLYCSVDYIDFLALLLASGPIY